MTGIEIFVLVIAIRSLLAVSTSLYGAVNGGAIPTAGQYVFGAIGSALIAGFGLALLYA